jgi:hypothetical protein
VKHVPKNMATSLNWAFRLFFEWVIHSGSTCIEQIYKARRSLASL